MAYQINFTGQEIDERLQNVGTAEDAAAADGTLYARIKKNADDIAENKENVKVLTKRVDVVTGTANSAEALAKANEKRLNTVTGTANTAKELAQTNQFNLRQVQATANTALKKSEVNQDGVRNAQITANEAKALVNGLTGLTGPIKTIERDVSQLKELNVVYPSNLRNLTVDSTPDEVKEAFIPSIGGTPGTTNTPHVGYLIKGNENSDNQDDPDSTIISVEIVKIDDKDCHKFMYIDNNRDLVTMTVCIWGGIFKVIERFVVSNIDTIIDKINTFGTDISTLQTAVSNNAKTIGKHTTTLTEHDARQTNIEEVVSVERSDVFFSLPHLLLYFRNYNPSVVYVTLYRWTGKRYHTFEIQRDTTGTFLEVAESYKITLENYGNDGLSYQLAITYADGTKEPLVEALKNAFGGRISHGRRKKRRWRLQAFLSGRPITAPFDFRVSVDHSGVVSLTKEGMMRSVPKAKEVVYNGFFSSAEWIKCKKGEIINCDYNASEKRFPQPGDFIESNRRGIVVASEYNSDGSYRILWTVGRTLYEIGIGGKVIEPSFVFYCTSPAKKLCDDIYDYASKMNSGTLRDLYISAGAKYNEATGYYELNGLTDITEEEMRVIYEKTWGWWLHLPYLNGFGSALPRTNIPCPDYKIIAYASNISIHSIFSASGNDDNLEVVNLRALYTPTGFDEIKIVDFNWSFQGDKKLREVQGIINVKEARSALNIGGNIETINIKGLKVNIRFYNSQRLSKESVLYMINNSAATSAITIGLNKAVYDVMKDDADIIAALAEKTNITLIQNT